MPTTQQRSDRCPVEQARVRLGARAKSSRTGGAEWRLDLGRFQNLHPDGRRLIEDWIDKAAAESEHNNKFEAFIYAWIGLNGWSSCCSGKDQDRTQLNLMMLDECLTDNFDRLTAEGSSADAKERFGALWPIFKVSDLPEPVRRQRPQRKGRASVISYYDELCPDAVRAPSCHWTHKPAVQRDWAHTLEALYQVRCNLFHGQKSGAGYEDKAIVDAAADVLLPVARSVLILR